MDVVHVASNLTYESCESNLKQVAAKIKHYFI